MVVGFNHNVRHNGELFHVQTEDSGLDRPQIVTLLYRGGTILASTKTSYADILKMENLESVVEELMKEQHKAMMYRLRAGEFDGGTPAGPPIPTATASDAAAAPAPLPTPPPGPGRSRSSGRPAPEPHFAPPSAVIPESCTSLDDAVMAFFASHE